MLNIQNIVKQKAVITSRQRNAGGDLTIMASLDRQEMVW